MIATTSSALKTAKLEKLGADHIINYRTDTNWGNTARMLTPEGNGVDHVIEVGGPETIQQSFNCIKMEGIISVVGFVGGYENAYRPEILDYLKQVCTVRGVQTGSKALMKDMIRAIDRKSVV